MRILDKGILKKSFKNGSVVLFKSSALYAAPGRNRTIAADIAALTYTEERTGRSPEKDTAKKENIIFTA